jgi:hypothetical protein
MANQSPIETIPQDLTIGLLATYLAGNGNSLTNALKGGSLDNRLPPMLYMEQSIIQNIYNLNPNDPNLRQTTNYLYSLYGVWGVIAQQRQQQLAQPIPVISNPANQSVLVGGTAVFSVTVASSLPYTIQWYLFGVPIAGATGLSYTITNAQLAQSNGVYYAVATNTAGSAQSGSATLTVTQSLNGFYWYGSTDPYPVLSTNVDNLTYQGTFPITSGQPLVVTWPLAAENNLFEVIKYPISQGVKSTWSFSPFNNGTFTADPIMRPIFSFGGYNYCVSRVSMSFASTANIETIT